MLKNPSYAGAYVHGRYQSVKDISPDGTFFTRVRQDADGVVDGPHQGPPRGVPLLGDVPARTRNARTEPDERTDPSGSCTGRTCFAPGVAYLWYLRPALTVRYTGNGGIYPVYECNWQRREGLSTTSCLQHTVRSPRRPGCRPPSGGSGAEADRDRH